MSKDQHSTHSPWQIASTLFFSDGDNAADAWKLLLWRERDAIGAVAARDPTLGSTLVLLQGPGQPTRDPGGHCFIDPQFGPASRAQCWPPASFPQLDQGTRQADQRPLRRPAADKAVNIPLFDQTHSLTGGRRTRPAKKMVKIGHSNELKHHLLRFL